jgi:hypothetical protein
MLGSAQRTLLTGRPGGDKNNRPAYHATFDKISNSLDTVRKNA